MKKVRHLLLMATTAALMGTALLSCCDKKATKEETPFIGKSDITIEGRRMTPEALWAMGRIGGATASPDGKQIAYGVTFYYKRLLKNTDQ